MSRAALLPILLLLSCALLAQEVRIAFWNVENLFDTHDDSLSSADDAFTPAGANHWTPKRYNQKLQGIYKTIVAMDCPAVVGLAEVENRHVLTDLTLGTPLARLNYRIIHFDSPDRRGIDCALLFRPALFAPFDTAILRMDFPTRDILQVGGTTPRGDTLILFVCHLPSRLGGAQAEQRRHACFLRLQAAMDSAAACHPSATLLAMGDFNTPPDQLPPIGYRSLMRDLPPNGGSYCYQGIWSYIDQFLTNHPTLQAHVFIHPALTEADAARLTTKPRRTYLGPRYHGGISDHLPIFTTLP